MIRRHSPSDDVLDPAVAADLAALEEALAGAPGADPELAALVRDVRAEAPPVDDDFLRSLDARVEAGFPRPERTGLAAVPGRLAVRARELAGALTWRPAVGVAAAALVAIVVALAALPGDGEETATSSGGDASTTLAAPEAAGDAGAGAPAPPAAESLRAPEPPDTVPPFPGPVEPDPVPLDAPRHVVRSADLELRTSPQDVQEVADGVIRVTRSVGGVVASSQVSTQEDGGEATFALEVPASRLPRALAELTALASVVSLDESTDDVTAVVVSAEDRLKDARDERDALVRALGRADSEREVESLRSRIRDAREAIARIEAEVRSLEARTDRASIAVTVRGASDEDDGGAGGGGAGTWTPGDAADDALRVLEVAAGVALVAAAVLAPIALLALLGLLVARVSRRRGRERALDATG